MSPVIHFSLWEEMFLGIWNFYSLLLLKTHHKGRLIERLFVWHLWMKTKRWRTKSKFMEIRQSYFCMWCVSQSCSLFTRVQISWFDLICQTKLQEKATSKLKTTHNASLQTMWECSVSLARCVWGGCNRVKYKKMMLETIGEPGEFTFLSWLVANSC